MIYRRLLPFETTKETDEFLPQVYNSHTSKWDHGKIWSNVKSYGWENMKVEDCIGKISGMCFKFRRKLV